MGMHIWRSVQQTLNDVLGWYHPNNRGNATVQQNCQNSLAQTYQSYLHTVMMTYEWKICLLQSLIVFTTGTIEHSYFSVHWVDVCVCMFTSIHRYRFICLGLIFQGTDRRYCVEDVSFLCQVLHRYLIMKHRTFLTIRFMLFTQ